MSLVRGAHHRSDTGTAHDVADVGWTGIADVSEIRFHPTLTGDADVARRSAYAVARDLATSF